MSRSWYISISAIWNECDEFGPLRGAIREIIQRRKLPYYHQLIREDRWHSTVFALVETKEGKQLTPTAEEYMTRLFSESITADLKDMLSKAFATFTARPKFLQCFNDGITIQFEDSQEIGNLRKEYYQILQPHVHKLCINDSNLRSLLEDTYKSNGQRLFGSIARSVDRNDSSILQWRESISISSSLLFRKVHLLVSDEALTNQLNPTIDLHIP